MFHHISISMFLPTPVLYAIPMSYPRKAHGEGGGGSGDGGEGGGGDGGGNGGGDGGGGDGGGRRQ